MTDIRNLPIEWLLGFDRRLNRSPSESDFGRAHWNSRVLYYQNIFSSGIFGGLSTSGMISTTYTETIRPIAVADPGYSTDIAGVPFPAGTLFVNYVAKLAPLQILFSAGTPLYGLPEYGEVYFCYFAAGIPAGATTTLALKNATTGATLVSVDIDGDDGAYQVIDFPPFIIPLSPDGVYCARTWSGGSPVTDYILSHPLMIGPNNRISGWIAVPTTLDAAFTPRNSDDGIYQSIQYRRFQNRRGRPGSGVPVYAGHDNGRIVGGTGYVGERNIWVDNDLWTYDFRPTANGRLVESYAESVSYTAPAGYTPPADVTASTVGIREGTGLFKSTSDFGPSTFLATVTRTDTGGILFSGTYDGPTLFAGVSFTTGAVLPAVMGDTVDILLHIEIVFIGAPPFTSNGTLALTIQGSPRCDIPLPFAATGPDGVATGGYLNSELAVPTFSRPKTELALGVTTYVGVESCLIFRPATDGWYQVLTNGAAWANVGENPFDNQSGVANIARGHVNRPFYCTASGSAPFPATLTAFTPSPTAIASSGTAVDVSTSGSRNKWGSIAAPAAGTYEVSIAISSWNKFLGGLILELSLTDPTALNYDYQARLETINEGGSGAPYCSGIQNDDTGLDHAYVYIVGTSPVNQFADHANDFAYYDSILAAWTFHTPIRGSTWIPNGALTSFFWFDGVNWKTQADPIIRQRFTVSGAQTVYFVLSSMLTTAGGSVIHVSWAAI